MNFLQNYKVKITLIHLTILDSFINTDIRIEKILTIHNEYFKFSNILATYGIDFSANSLMLTMNNGKNDLIILKNENEEVAFQYIVLKIFLEHVLYGIKIVSNIVKTLNHLYI